MCAFIDSFININSQRIDIFRHFWRKDFYQKSKSDLAGWVLRTRAWYCFSHSKTWRIWKFTSSPWWNLFNSGSFRFHLGLWSPDKSGVEKSMQTWQCLCGCWLLSWRYPDSNDRKRPKSASHSFRTCAITIQLPEGYIQSNGNDLPVCLRKWK